MFNQQTAARFEFDAIEGVADDDRVEALYFNTVEFAGDGLSFATRVTLERITGSTEFRSTRLELLDLRAAVDRDAYGVQMAGDHDIVVVIHPDNVTMTNPVTTES
ncbi:hypothetical protein [Brevundimonas sp. DWR2-3-1b1]|uniref:hypothetical protein n=1 Tax=unclassified Brevundimonas TaxID=2622653 RepID=UPI003CF1B878